MAGRPAPSTGNLLFSAAPQHGGSSQSLNAEQQRSELSGTHKRASDVSPDDGAAQLDQCVPEEHRQAFEEQQEEQQQHQALAEELSAAEAGQNLGHVGGCSSGQHGAMVKERMRWTPELHAKFVYAVKILGGAYRAKPKEILDILRIPGLSLNHVKSHLQKYRLSEAPFETQELQPPVDFQRSQHGPDDLLGQIRLLPGSRAFPSLPIAPHVTPVEAGMWGLYQPGVLAPIAGCTAAGHHVPQQHPLPIAPLQRGLGEGSGASGAFRMPAAEPPAQPALHAGATAAAMSAPGGWLSTPWEPLSREPAQSELPGTEVYNGVAGGGTLPDMEEGTAGNTQGWQVLLSLAGMLQDSQQQSGAETAKKQEEAVPQQHAAPAVPSAASVAQLEGRIAQLRQSVVQYAQAAAALQQDFYQKLQAHIKVQRDFLSQLTDHIEGVRHLATHSLAPLDSQLASLSHICAEEARSQALARPATQAARRVAGEKRGATAMDWLGGMGSAGAASAPLNVQFGNAREIARHTRGPYAAGTVEERVGQPVAAQQPMVAWQGREAGGQQVPAQHAQPPVLRSPLSQGMLQRLTTVQQHVAQHDRQPPVCDASVGHAADSASKAPSPNVAPGIAGASFNPSSKNHFIKDPSAPPGD